MGKRPPVVILTALELEYQAVRERTSGVRRLRPVDGTLFETGAIGKGKVVIAAMGQGTHGAVAVTQSAIRAFSPSAVLLVGIAGALKPDIHLGDVVVATHVYGYHGAAARTDGLKARPRVWEIGHNLEQLARHVSRRPEFTVHFGPVASGEILHDAADSEPLRWIREHYDDALAIEMEAAGVAKGAHLGASPVAVVRGISDRADGSKSGTDATGGQQLAVGNAAAFALALAEQVVKRAPRERDQGRRAAEIRVRTQCGRHGVVAGVVNGGVHNTGTAPVDPGRC